MLDLEEMRHVLTRVGDTMTPEETANFFSMVDNFGDGYARMDQLMELVIPKQQQAIKRQLDGNY